jgi:hypothetical protein
MNRDEVLSAVSTMEAVFRQYLLDVPEYQRREESLQIQNAIDAFLRNSHTLLPPTPSPSPQTCPRCNGKGTI